MQSLHLLKEDLEITVTLIDRHVLDNQDEL
jgi:hypothetical protein